MSDVRIQRGVQPQLNPSPSKEKVDPRIMEAAKSFENQFLRFMVKEMRKSEQGGDSLIPDSIGQDIFKEKLDDSYVDSWVDTGGVGLSQIVYENLMERYGPQTTLPKNQNEFLPTDGIKTGHATKSFPEKMNDILGRQDGALFLAKKLEKGFHLKSKDPLEKRVSLLAPHSGVILQAASLGDGRSAVTVRQAEGLVTEIVHTGRNSVTAGTKIAAGSTIAELQPSRQGELGEMFLRLRSDPPK